MTFYKFDAGLKHAKNVGRNVSRKTKETSVKTAKIIMELISKNHFITIHEIAQKIGMTIRICNYR